MFDHACAKRKPPHVASDEEATSPGLDGRTADFVADGA
jgi:hypothetical protein